MKEVAGIGEKPISFGEYRGSKNLQLATQGSCILIATFLTHGGILSGTGNFVVLGAENARLRLQNLTENQGLQLINGEVIELKTQNIAELPYDRSVSHSDLRYYPEGSIKRLGYSPARNEGSSYRFVIRSPLNAAGDYWFLDTQTAGFRNIVMRELQDAGIDPNVNRPRALTNKIFKELADNSGKGAL